MQLLVQVPQVQLFLPLLQRRFLALQAFEQFIEVDRLLVVIRDPCAQGLDHILLVGTPGEHDRLERTLLVRHFLHGLHQFDAIHVRHMQVAQHQADLGVFAEALQGVSAGLTGDAAVTAGFKKFAEFFHDQRLIVDHEHFYRRGKLVHALLHAWQAKGRPIHLDKK